MSKITPQLAVCTFALTRSDGAIQLFPAGDFDAPQGALRGQGPWRLDAATAAALIATVAQRANPLVIDYEHQTLLAAQNGQPAPAAGWLTGAALQWRDSGLWATDPQWTARAAEHIAAGEYRYLSPVFRYATDGTVLDLVNVALTNQPAIDGMAAVALAAATAALTSSPTTGGTAMADTAIDPKELLERLCYLLNLPLTSTSAEVVAELDKVRAILQGDSSSDAAASLNLLARLTADAAEIAALKAAAPDPAQYVPIAVMDDLQQRLAAATVQHGDERVIAVVAAAEASGKVLLSQRDWALALGRADFAALTRRLERTPCIDALTTPQTQTAGVAAATAQTAVPTLTADELAVCKQMGLTSEQFLAAKKTV